jgi:hypothetical protein
MCCQHAVVAEMYQALERVAPELQSVDVDNVTFVRVPRAVRKLLPVARENEMAWIDAGFVFGVEVSSVKTGLAKAHLNRHVRLFCLNDEDSESQFPDRKVGVVTAGFFGPFVKG